MLSQRARRVDLLIDYILSDSPFPSANPTNMRTAYRKFRTEKKNPSFRYEKPKPSLEALQGALIELPLKDEGILGDILEHKKRRLIRRIAMMQAIGKAKYPKLCEVLYPPPDEHIIAIASEIVKLPISRGQGKIPKAEAVKAIRHALTLLGFKWKIVNRDMVTSAATISGTRVLELRKRERFSKKYVNRLIIHELGTHALRAENGSIQPLRLFRHGLAGYLETEEGLAAYHEFLSGVMSTSILRNYAGRVLAIHYARHTDFVTTYKLLSRHFREQTAWKLAVRAKRGLADTSQKGAFTRDAVYLRGFLRVYAFAKKHDIRQLYVGKIGISDMASLQMVKDMKRPLYTPAVVCSEFGNSEPEVTSGMIDGILKAVKGGK